MNRLLRNFLAGLVLICWASGASAAPAWYVVEVDMTGISFANSVLIKLTHTASSPAFTAKWFAVPAVSQKEMLATSLAAITTGMRMTIRTDLASATIPNLIRLFVQK